MIARILCTAFLLGLLPPVARAELPSVRLTVSGADPATGTIEATLFNSAEDFLLKAYLQKSGEVADDGSFTAEFVGVEEGEYAIVVVHDANGNGVYDAGLFGFGGEAVGYSNDASGWFGRPAFDDARFTVDGAGKTIQISLD